MAFGGGESAVADHGGAAEEDGAEMAAEGEAFVGVVIGAEVLGRVGDGALAGGVPDGEVGVGAGGGGNQPASPNGSVRETRKWVSVPFEARVRKGPPNIWSNRTEQV